MNRTLSTVIIFAAGVVTGVAVTCSYFKNKYGRIADEEIESVRKALEKSDPDNEKPVDDAARAAEIIKECGYASDSGDERPEMKGDETMEKPYVISPDEYDENGYKTRSLTYYKDGVLTDSKGKVVKDVESLIGEDSLNHFGEYEDDSVFVRNDRLRIDFEILMDYRKYSDICGG